tara:strand:+ start:256 stop:777 length:522 start_codon:yes stop_codon:yes gene_type:complete
MIKGVQVVAASCEGVVRAYTSHWVCQVSFDTPILMASISPKHDTYPLIKESGTFSVSILAGDQIEPGQYFSYPGRKFRYIAKEWLTEINGWWVVPESIAWLGCEVEDRILGRYDHDLFFARVVEYGEGRLENLPLLYSSRSGWRTTGESAREKGDSVRDRLLARLDEEGDVIS